MKIFIFFYFHQGLGQRKGRLKRNQCICCCWLVSCGESLALLIHCLALTRKLYFFGSLRLPCVNDDWGKFRKHFEVHSWNVVGVGEKMGMGLRSLSPLSASLVKILAVSARSRGYHVCLLPSLLHLECNWEGTRHPSCLDILCIVFVPLLDYNLWWRLFIFLEKRKHRQANASSLHEYIQYLYTIYLFTLSNALELHEIICISKK